MRSLRKFMEQAFSFAILLACCVNTSQAVITSDELGSHVTEAGRSSFGVNVDGVVLIAGDVPNSETLADLLPLCTGVLISSRHLLSAAHCFDQDENGVVDFIFNFPHVAAFELADDRTVMIDIDTSAIGFPELWPEAYADVAVITLQEEAPESVPRYSLFGGSNEVGHPFVLVGYGSPGHGSTGKDPLAEDHATKRAGMNRYDDIRDDGPGVDFLAYDFDSGHEEHNALRLTGLDSDLGFGVDEVLGTSGDSGGPTFIGGVIAGITSFGSRLPVADFTDAQDSSWGEGGFDTRVSNFRDFITAATNGEAVFAHNEHDTYDLDLNGEVNVADIDALVKQIIAVQRGDEVNLAFDLSDDGIVDTGDRDQWLIAAAGINGFADSYLLGDANLDGTIDAHDLNALGQNWLGHPDTWTSGDFSADGTVDAADLNQLGQNWQASITAASEGVPEPSSAALLYGGVFLAVVLHWRKDGGYMTPWP